MNKTRGKVGTSGREIQAALWGSRGRPETNAYAELCAERQQNLKAAREGSLVVREVIKAPREPRVGESPRTTAKWAKARIVNAKV